MEGDEEKIKLTKDEGAIILRGAEAPEIYAPIGVSESCDSIRFTLAFLLYAVDRDDWIEEFSDFVDELQENYRKSDAIARRLSFEVIDGEKE